MKGLPEFPETYFLKFDTTPVRIFPFNPTSTLFADKYVYRLRNTLSNLDVEVIIRGSTTFKIAGKGDIEFGVYPVERYWEGVLKKLETLYGLPGNTEQDYVRFDHIKDGFEIEIIVMRGWRAIVDRRLTGYLLCHPALLEEYERVKLTNAHSKRQYQKAKDRFFRAVIEKIPDDYSDLT
jgi:hypothetical protein